MPRCLAYLDPGGGPVETCTQTIQGYALLRPGPEEDELTLGVLGRALDYYRVDLYAFAFCSSHYLCAVAHNTITSSTVPRASSR